MKRKFLKIHAPDVPLSNTIGLRRLDCFLEKRSQLCIEIFRELGSGDLFVIVQDLRDVRGDLTMKLQSHQPRRPRIWESSCSREIVRSGLASRSVSRCSASAMPSSLSDKIAGSDSRRFAARAARCRSGRSSASFSTSIIVAMGEGYSWKSQWSNG